MEYLSSGMILFIPVFLWNALCYKKLPEFYQPAVWDNIPKPLDVAENILRGLTFLSPILFRISLDTPTQVAGMALYGIGLPVYFVSWIIQMRPGTGSLKTKAAFRTAPAYTALPWLLGTGLLGRESLIPSFDIQTAYFFMIAAFIIVHTYHAFLVFRKTAS